MHHALRKNVIFLQAEYLLAQADQVRTERIENCGSVAITVVDGVDGAGGIAIRKGVIQARGAEILPDNLQRTAQILLDPIVSGNLGVRGVRRRKRPEIHYPELLHSGHSVQARLCIGDQGDRSLMERFAESLVVGEKEGFIFLERPTCGNAKLISLGRRRRTSSIEEVARV